MARGPGEKRAGGGKHARRDGAFYSSNVGDGVVDNSLYFGESRPEDWENYRPKSPRPDQVAEALKVWLELEGISYEERGDGVVVGADPKLLPGIFKLIEQLDSNTADFIDPQTLLRGSAEERAIIEKVLQKLGRPVETYKPIDENPFIVVARQPVSTFSIDVDTASYSNIRRYLLQNMLPPADLVRVEEMINSFQYDYPIPDREHPFSVTADVGECPWASDHRLVRVGLKGYEVRKEDRPAANLVFLIDISASMNEANKLPLVKQGLNFLLDQLWADDRVGIVVYGDNAHVWLESTPGSRLRHIQLSIAALSTGGGTNGAAGIKDAYAMARDNFIEGGVNRVMLCTDGDFNVGVSDDNELVKLIAEEANSGVFLSVLGFGTGNLKDGKLEALADKGNGHYAYIDDAVEAKRVLGDEVGATLQTIAKDVKIQVEFNPALVHAYRLIGYENRVMANRDFADDTKDAGEIGAGHSVTALYEVVPEETPRRHGGHGEEDVQDGDREGMDDPNPSREGAEETPKRRNAETPKREQTASATGDEFDDIVASDDQVDESAAPATDQDNEPGAQAMGLPDATNALLILRLRYKLPDSDTSTLIETPLTDDGMYIEQMSRDFLFASAVASFGMVLRQSPHVADWSLEATEELARSGMGDDPTGYRTEFVDLVRKAIELREKATGNGR